MSFETWMEEFYPITAEQAAKISEREAIIHSLQKFIGARQENLEKHGVKFYNKRSPFFITGKTGIPPSKVIWIKRDDPDYLFFCISSCSLCMMNLDSNEDLECDKCPIVKSGNIGCGELDSGWDKFLDLGDPKLMIDVLQKTLKWNDRNNGNQA